MSKNCKSYGKAKLDEKFEVTIKWKRARKIQLYVSVGLLGVGRTLLTEDPTNTKMKCIGHVFSSFGVAGIVSVVYELVESNANHSIQNSLNYAQNELQYEIMNDLDYEIHRLKDRVDSLEKKGNLDTEE